MNETSTTTPQPFTDDIVKAIRESGMTFHLGMPNTVVIEQLARFADLISAQATIKAASAFATQLAQPAPSAPEDQGCNIGRRLRPTG